MSIHEAEAQYRDSLVRAEQARKRLDVISRGQFPDLWLAAVTDYGQRLGQVRLALAAYQALVQADADSLARERRIADPIR